MIDRESVRANAKYLRHVRPIDPEEIYEYIEGRPHPGVVRRVLREEAFDLALFERPDGTFVPASDDPVEPPGWTPRQFPATYARVFEDLLSERFGPEWYLGDSGERLRRSIRRLKEDYYRRNPVAYDDLAALGYGLYHLPDYYAAVGYVLDDLAERGLLARRLRVLDVGAGAGGPALGLHDYLPEDAVVDYHAVEPSEAAAAVLEQLLDATRPNVRSTIHCERAETFAFDRDYDLVLFANVLSELDAPADVVERALDSLTDGGSVVAIAPADLHTATHLREVERSVAPPDGDVTVYSPTLRLWPGSAPSDRGWSFDVRPEIEAPAFQRRLDEAGDSPGTYRNTTVQFAYAILRTDGERRTPILASATRHARMADMERHVTNRIDLLAVKLSRDLSARVDDEGDDSRREKRDDGTRNPVFKIGDGSERTDHYAVLTRESTLNRDLSEADYGDVLAFENALALWNEDEEAYNLVVDGETVVDRLA